MICSDDLQTCAAWIPAGCRQQKPFLSIVSMDWKSHCSILRWAGAAVAPSCSHGERWSGWWRGWRDIYGLMRMTGQNACTLRARLHTRVCEKPCLRKTQAGPTMLCSMLQFFTSVPKELLNRSSSTSRSSAASTALIFPSTSPFRGRQCYFHRSDSRSLNGIVFFTPGWDARSSSHANIRRGC